MRFGGLFGKRMKTQDTRRFKRFRVSYLVRYQVNGKGEPRITNARDISAGGLRFWTKEALAPSSVLDISIYLPPLRRSVEAVSQVLRVRRSRDEFIYSVAVSFLDIKEEDQKELRNFAESLSKDRDGKFMIDHASVVVRKTS